MPDDTVDASVAVAEAERRTNAWLNYGKRWGVTHNVLGSLAIIFGAVTGIFADGDHRIVAVLGVASAVVGGMMTFLKPSERKNGYIRAWRLVRNVSIRVQSEPGHGIKELNDALDTGESLIKESD